MNAHSTITADRTGPSAELVELATKVLSGEWPRPYGIGGIYTAPEWTNAAQYAVDADDWTELAYMVAQEEDGDEYAHTFADRDDGPDFDHWRDAGKPGLSEYLAERAEWYS